MTIARRVCVFCGSASGTDPAFAAAAAALGLGLAQRRIGLVYGGAHVGLMGTLADGVLEGGGEVLGVIPESLREREIAHPGLTELRVVADMHERKRVMYSAADAFVAMPGGYGTMEEVFEATTWNQLGLHDGRSVVKRLALMDVSGFWEPLVGFLDDAVDAGFVKEKNRPLIEHVQSVPGILDWLGSMP